MCASTHCGDSQAQIVLVRQSTIVKQPVKGLPCRRPPWRWPLRLNYRHVFSVTATAAVPVIVHCCSLQKVYFAIKLIVQLGR